MSLAERKVIELRHKLASLTHEFQFWRDQSEERQLWQKHHTQIRRITGQLTGFCEEVSRQLQVVAGNAEQILAACRELELTILEVHRIWDFFRSKLALRSVERFQAYLFVADEFAWTCYEAAQQKVISQHIGREEIKEPPLVFFNGGSSPFTSSRHQSYEAEAVPGEGLKTPVLINVLKALPIPVIGVPWFQIQHLPDALVIGHEVGHNVEDDLRLTPRLHALLKQAMAAAQLPAQRREAWGAWLGEIFADVFGNLAAGPAFVGALMDFLVLDKTVIMQDRRSAPSWGTYPPDYVRMLLNFALLTQQGFAADSARLQTDWTATYPSHAMPEFEADIPIVIRALVQGPYPEFGDVALSQVLSFSAAEHQRAVTDAALLLGKYAPESDDVRSLLASARLAYEQEPAKYGALDLHSRIVNRVPKKIGVRSAQRQKQPQTLNNLEAYDRQAGVKLFDTIAGLRRDPGTHGKQSC